MTFAELGKKFVELGRALQDDTATVEEIVTLAHACGVQLEFRIAPPYEAMVETDDESQA